MGKQYNKVEKARRRKAYQKRRQARIQETIKAKK